MRDYITIGSSPSGEDCVSVSDKTDYIIPMREECKRFKELLQKKFPNAKLGIKGFDHDFGRYYEVVAYFDDEDEESMNTAYEVEANCPEYWETEGEPNAERTDAVERK